MSSQLHPKEVELFRCLKKTAIVLMLLFRLDKPVGEREIAGILDIHPQTIRTYLASLAHLGVVTRTHRYQGWMLTGGGRQMILGESTGQIHGQPARKIKTSAKKSRSNAKISRSLPLAAASLSFKVESNTVAAAAAGASAKKSRSSAKISRSRFGRGMRNSKKRDQTATGSGRSDPMVRADLEAFASIGLARNDFVLEICQMDHVTPDYIRGQKNV
jgi:hypothetical protein